MTTCPSDHPATALDRTEAWFTPDDCRLDDFRAVVEQTTDPADYPRREELGHRGYS